jgi:hypothetical protein
MVGSTALRSSLARSDRCEACRSFGEQYWKPGYVQPLRTGLARRYCQIQAGRCCAGGREGIITSHYLGTCYSLCNIGEHASDAFLFRAQADGGRVNSCRSKLVRWQRLRRTTVLAFPTNRKRLRSMSRRWRTDRPREKTHLMRVT